MPGQKFETKQRITVRNLRIREDTAKVGPFILLFPYSIQYNTRKLYITVDLSFQVNQFLKTIFISRESQNLSQIVHTNKNETICKLDVIVMHI